MYRYTLPTTSLSQEISEAHAIFSGHTSSITDFAILPDNRIASASYDHTIKLWDLAAGNCERTLTEHTECVWALVMLSNGMLASGSGDKLIKLWNPMTGICTITLYETAQVLALTQISEDLLASGCWDKSVKIWNFVTQRCMKRLEEHQGSVWALTPISKDFLASGSYDSSIKIWNIKNEDYQTLIGHSGYVVALTRLTENKLASGSHDKSIKIWNLETGLCEQTLLGHLGSVTALALLSNEHLASGSYDASIKIWNLATGLCEQTLIGHLGSVNALALLLDQRLVSGSTDRSIKIWDIEPALALATTTADATGKRIKSKTSLLQNEVTMKEYTELGQLFVQHGHPTDYHAFLEHPDVQNLKTQLGKELASIFLCLLRHRCQVSATFLQRLVRYKEEKRLRDLEVAMLELVKAGFELTVTLLDDMCAKAGRDSTFLLSVRLIKMAKQAGFFNYEHNQIPEEIFTLLKTSKIALYEKLLEKSALDIHVLKNASISDMPKNAKDLEASVDIYYYATLCGCTALLNYPSEHKMYVLSMTSKYENNHVASILKNLHETQRLSKETFLLTCNISMSASYLLPTLTLLEKAPIDLTFFCRCILDRKKDFRKMRELHEILDMIERGALIAIDDDLVQTLILLTDNLNIILESLYYLEQRDSLTPTCFLWVLDYYEEKTLKKSTALPSRKAHSMLSPGLFSARNSEKTSMIEISVVLFALSETHLLEKENKWMPYFLTSSGAEFIQQLFQLNELNQHAIDLAREADFEKNALENIVTLASYHRGFPEKVPAAHASEFLECLVLLASLATSLSVLIQAFAFNHAPLLKRLLTLLRTEQALTIEAMTVLIEDCQRTEEPATLLKEKVFCWLLKWPMSAAESLATSRTSSEVLFKSLQALQNAQIDLSSGAEFAFIFPELCQSTDPLLDTEIIKGLFTAHALHQNLWELVPTMSLSQKRFLIPAIQRLAQHGQCNHASLALILSSKNLALALQVFLLLTAEQLSISMYWTSLMQHAVPLLLCQGLIELNTQGVLTADYFSKISIAKQPFLAAKALLHLLQASIPLESYWGEIATTENPEDYAQMMIASTTPGKLDENLPLTLQQAVAHHPQPKLARQHLALLHPISNITTAQRLRILPREEASDIVQALLQLNELTPLNDALIELMIENSGLVAPLKKYFALSSPSETLFTQLCQANSVREAENLIKREEIMTRLRVEHPQVAALLQEIFFVSSSHQHQWTTALAFLQSVDEVNPISIGYLQQTSAPEKMAAAIVALKKAGLYTADYFNRASRKENQTPGVYNALRYLAEEGNLNEALFNFVIINSDHQTVKAAKLLLKMPDVQRAHLNWLAAYTPRDDFRNAAVDIIHKLHDLNGLNRFWIEKIMQQKKPTLEDIAYYVYDLPSTLLNETNLKKIFDCAGNCYFSEDGEEAEEYHSPFRAFEQNRSLLTQEVLELLLVRSGYQYAAETVYTNMVALKQAALFHPEIVACCTTKDRTQAIIALSNAQQWNEINKAIVLASPEPQADASLILCLAQQNKYSLTTAQLLLLRLQLNQENTVTKEWSGSYRYYFSKLIQQLLTRETSLQESTVQHLLTLEIKWKTIKTILDNIEDKIISDTQLCVIAATDPCYLDAYVTYMQACCQDEMKLSDVLKLYEYESLLNRPELLAAINKTISKEARKKPFNKEAMQQLLNDLWQLCATGDQAAITARLLSATESTAVSTVVGYRP